MKNILTAVTAAILLGSCATGVNLSGKWEIVSLNGETVNAIETKPFLRQLFPGREKTFIREHGHYDDGRP